MLRPLLLLPRLLVVVIAFHSTLWCSGVSIVVSLRELLGRFGLLPVGDDVMRVLRISAQANDASSAMKQACDDDEAVSVVFVAELA